MQKTTKTSSLLRFSCKTFEIKHISDIISLICATVVY